MSYGTVMQLHKNIESLAAKNPGLAIGMSTAKMFNANLEETQKSHPDNVILQAIESASEKTKYEELVVLTGQLQQILEDEEGGIVAGFLG